MDQAIARAIGAMPSTTQPAAAPRLVGEFQGYVDGIVPSVRWLDRKNMPQVGDRLFAIPAHVVAARAWSILLTSANHGVVGPLGHAFKHAGEHHERVVVVEVPAGAGAPSDQVNLVLRAPLAEARIYDIAAASELGIGADDDEMAKRTAFARAIEREVAAQAGQVAVPEGWKLVPVESCGKMTKAGEKALRKLLGSTATTFDAYSCYAAMLAAAPSAPAVAQQAPADWISVDERLPDGKYCLATYQDRAGKLRIIRAMYVRQFEIEASGDECDSETNEENDREYLKAGWYELIDNWGEYSSVHVSEGPVTHWMPLPPSPAKESK